MRRRTKVVFVSLVMTVAVVSIAAIAAVSVDTRTIGRTDPKRAANYRLPWFNFYETYTDGEALGVRIGSSRDEAIHAAERAGLTVEPGSWGDNRAGGADLYRRSELIQMMRRQPSLSFGDMTDTKRGMTIRLSGDRVVSVNVYYINSEAL